MRSCCSTSATIAPVPHDVIEPIRKLRGVIGTGNSPHTIYLLQRGLKTLELRMQRHNENGLALA